MYDVAIIGAGVVGCSIARELSKYRLSICLVEKEEDVSCGASKANSGIIHGGYSAKHGTLKGILCTKGNGMYAQLEKELHFGYRKTGALVLGYTDEDRETIAALYQNGIDNGCRELEIIEAPRIREIEPYIHPDVLFALYDKSVGVASPYELTIALAENAIQNGAKLHLETEVSGIEPDGDGFLLHTSIGEIRSRFVVNAAGVFSDKVPSMLGLHDFSIHPRRGQYILLGKDQGHLANTVIFQCPTKLGKGILVTTTVHHNLMIGPDAEDMVDREDVATTEESLRKVVIAAHKSIPNFNIKKALTTFSGVRAIGSTGDFIIGKTRIEGFINAAGIESPGLTSSPAIAEMVVRLLSEEGLSLVTNTSFVASRPGIILKKDDSFKGSFENALPEEHIICRCETVTEAEILDAMHRGIPIRSIDAVKRRTRAGMGPCQGAFCRPRVRSLIARELGIPEEAVSQRGNTAPRPERVDISIIRKFEE